MARKKGMQFILYDYEAAYNKALEDRRKKGFYVTGTVRYKAPYDEKVHDGSLY